METLNLVSLNELIKLTSNDSNKLKKLCVILSSFKCDLNKDEEDFIHHKAIEFENKNITRTYLLVDKDYKINAYFSIGLKPLEFKNKTISKNLWKKSPQILKAVH